MLAFSYALSDSEYFTKPIGLSLFKIRENSRVYHSRVKIHAISEIGVCLAEVNSFSNRSPSLQIRQIFGYPICLVRNVWRQFFGQVVTHFLMFLSNNSLLDCQSSLILFNLRTDILYHSYTFIPRW